GNTGTTCRFHGDSKNIPKNTSYGVYGTATTGKGGELSGQGGAGIEITTGGPGSEDDNCCGITTGIKADNKYFFIATEDWRSGLGINGKHTYLCSDNPGDLA
ncbi:MAG: hypothetical protein WBE68_25890, partial [Candidatus Nitrosopolaris sp.]